MDRQSPTSLTTSPEGIALICDSEGFRTLAYLDGNGIPTGAYGHTASVTEEDVANKRVFTLAEGRDLLKADLAEAEREMSQAVKVPLTQSEFDAMASLWFNIGRGRLPGSMGPTDKGKDGILVLKSGRSSTILATLNAGNYEAAAGCFTQWRQPGSINELGLLRRRVNEMLHFMGLPYQAASRLIKARPAGPEQASFLINACIAAAKEQKDDQDGLQAPASVTIITDKPKPAETVIVHSAVEEAAHDSAVTASAKVEVTAQVVTPAPKAAPASPQPQAAPAVTVPIKDILTSRRGWGTILNTGGHIITVGGVTAPFGLGPAMVKFGKAYGAVINDPVTLELACGAAVFTTGWILVHAGGLLKKIGEHHATQPLGTEHEVRIAKAAG